MRSPKLFIDGSRGVLRTACIISACLIVGCQSDLAKYYKPARTAVASSTLTQSRNAPPRLIYSSDPDLGGRLLRQDGYELLGTISFNGDADLSFDRAAAI